jgi:hypothetical protein
MNVAEITALASGITAVIGSVTTLIVTLRHQSNSSLHVQEAKKDGPPETTMRQ